MQINLIYTPGLTRFLSLFLLSLINSSTQKILFHVYDNGCTQKEKEILRKIQALYPDRVIYEVLQNDKQVELHGVILDRIYKTIKPADFCFMDTDIYAVGSFEEQIELYSQEADAFFSCFPIWMKNEYLYLQEKSNQIGGPNFYTKSGICLGGSYFSYYKGNIIDFISNKEQLTFRKYCLDELSGDKLNYLKEHALLKAEYDTAKLFNIMLYKNKKKALVKNIDNLIHIGGLAINALSNQYKMDIGKVSLDKNVNYGFEREWMISKRMCCDIITRHLSNTMDKTDFSINLEYIEDMNLRSKIEATLINIDNLYAQHRDLYKYSC